MIALLVVGFYAALVLVAGLARAASAHTTAPPSSAPRAEDVKQPAVLAAGFTNPESLRSA